MELHNLRKWQLKGLQRQVSQELRRRYFDHRPPAYGSLNKTFESQEELLKFLSFVTNIRVRMIFLLQLYLGLRIGEACRIQVRDIDFFRRKIWIRSAKDSEPAEMILHDRIYFPLKEYYQMCAEEMNIYFFPAQARGNNKNYPHVSPAWVGKEFRIAREKAQCDFVYAHSFESSERKPRRLFKLSSHSFRRWFIQNVHQVTGDIYKTKKAARHRKVQSTEIYLHAQQKEIDSVISRAFN